MKGEQTQDRFSGRVRAILLTLKTQKTKLDSNPKEAEKILQQGTETMKNYNNMSEQQYQLLGKWETNQ